jgi:hypothetical protein
MITYITVHGTGDGERPADSERQWWRPDSDFSSDLLAKSPPGSRIEPFLWSGENDETARRDAAERLLARLRRANDAGERVHPVGHSHGGSVIALALRFAAADGRKLTSLAGFTTVGTPFLALKLPFSPWGRFGSLGKALFTFLIPAAIIFSMMLLWSLWGFFTSIAEGTLDLAAIDGWVLGLAGPFLVGAGIVTFACLFGLSWLRRSRRGLFGRRSLRRLEKIFRTQWLGLYSRHDEAIAGLIAAAHLNARVFDRTVLRAPLAHAALVVFLTPIVAVWSAFFVGTLYNMFDADLNGDFVDRYNDSFFGPMHALAHKYIGVVFGPMLQAHHELVSELRNFWFSSDLFGLASGPAYDDVIMWNLASVGFPLTLLASYIVALTAWLWLVDMFALRLAGPIAARVLNSSISGALLDRAYGSHTVAERAVNASSSPFAAAQARVIPEEIDRVLFDNALASAGETFRKMREEIFATDRAAFDPINSAMKQLTWSELVHTCYFRVGPARAYLAAATAEHAMACVDAVKTGAGRAARADATIAAST